jgi:hypothetical protein
MNDKSVRRNIMFIIKLCTHLPENAPVSVKSGVVLHPLSDYGKTTNEGCDLLRFAPFCKKCSTTRAIKLKNISPQNVLKHGISGYFEKGKNYD